MKIKAIVENVKSYLDLIKWGLIVIFALSTFFGWNLADRMKEKAEKFRTIAQTSERQFQNKLGQMATEVSTWEMTYKELENAFKKKESERSDYEKKLVEAKRTIDLYKRKEKDLVSYTQSELVSSDTIFVELPQECIGRIEPIKTKNLTVEFFEQQFIYEYHAKISTLVTLFPKRKDNGKKHFPNWGAIWGWDSKAITSADDPNAEIINAISIDFRK